MNLLIDCREKMFVKTYADIDKTLVQVKPLDMGDFQVVEKETLMPYMIMERKTVQDVKASVIDGRYREQKDRLLCFRKEHPDTRICYVLEGVQPFNPLEKMLNGVVINTVLRDQIPFFFTQNQEETWDLLWDLFQRISKDEDMFKRSYNYAPSMRTHMESVSKTSVTPKKSQNVDTFVLQLSCIEGVGTRKAYDIINGLGVKSMNDVCKLDIQQLQSVKGIGASLAAKIKTQTCGQQ